MAEFLFVITFICLLAALIYFRDLNNDIMSKISSLSPTVECKHEDSVNIDLFSKMFDSVLAAKQREIEFLTTQLKSETSKFVDFSKRSIDLEAELFSLKSSHRKEFEKLKNEYDLKISELKTLNEVYQDKIRELRTIQPAAPFLPERPRDNTTTHTPTSITSDTTEVNRQHGIKIYDKSLSKEEILKSLDKDPPPSKNRYVKPVPNLSETSGSFSEW